MAVWVVIGLGLLLCYFVWVLLNLVLVYCLVCLLVGAWYLTICFDYCFVCCFYCLFVVYGLGSVLFMVLLCCLTLDFVLIV